VIPRIVIAAPASGAGKTTVATGLVAALAGRGLRPAAFKVGPDFIDPSYYRLASGRSGRNLDAFMSGEELIAPLFRHGADGADIAVIEGVMGLFDGLRGHGDFASTAHVARLLDAPVVLVVDAQAIAGSIAALVSGFAAFDRRVRVAGVILNKVGSPAHEEMLREALAAIGTPVLGVLAREEGLVLPERHLGLVPAAEREASARRTVDQLGERIAAGAGSREKPWRRPESFRMSSAFGSRSRRVRRSASVMRRISSSCAQRGRSCSNSTRSPTRFPRAPMRCCSAGASQRRSLPSSATPRDCVRRFATTPPRGDQ